MIHAPVTFRAWWLASTRLQRQAVADGVGVTYRYLQRMSGGFARPSYELMMALARQIPGLDVSSFEAETQRAGKRTASHSAAQAAA